MMGDTYRAVLRGNRIEWIDPAPNLEGDTEVVITFLDAEQEEVLREIPQDRPPPGREE